MVAFRFSTLVAIASSWRFFSLAAIALVALACTEGASPGRGVDNPGDVDSPEADSDAQCSVASDCEAAGSSCCECPTFAVPVTDGFGSTCDDVDCQVPAQCPATRAECVAGGCVLQCAPVECTLGCESGFARDAFGCLVCACAGPANAPVECSVDSDCRRVANDCCGCSRGGDDTAVARGQEGDHAESLGCEQVDTLCPEVNICDDGHVARCIRGTCTLSPADSGGGVSPPSFPGQPCGTVEYPSCPDGQQCVLNDPNVPEAGAMGAGVCHPE